MNLSFITGNDHKFEEASEILEDQKLIHKDLSYPEIQADTLEEVAKYGIEHIKSNYDMEESFFLEDAGLFVDELNGFPGVYSSYVFSTIGNQGILDLMKTSGRNANFKSVIALYDGDLHIFKGQVNGRISREIKGEHGFGFDPIFIPDGENLTFGELDPDKKNDLSHRKNSLFKLKKFLEE